MRTDYIARFSRLFSGLSKAYGTYTVDARPVKSERGKVSGKARTIRGEVTERCWRDHLAGTTGLGIIPINDDNRCGFAAIDVDTYNLNLDHLSGKIRKFHLPLIVCRTKSGGAHLLIFFREPEPAGEVRARLMEWMITLGFPQMEIFPKQSELSGEDDIGSWINLPYFGGDRTVRYAVIDGKNLSLGEFLDHAEASSTTLDAVSKIEIPYDTDLVDGPPCLQHLTLSGFPIGTRNQALFDLAIFSKMKFGDNWKEKVTEFNKKFFLPPLSEPEVNTVLKSVDRKKYFYRCKEQPLVSVCNKVTCTKRKFGIRCSNDDPGITLDGMMKILTDPPMWMMNVNGKRIKMQSSEDFLMQGRFTRVCVDMHNILPQKVNENSWREIVRDLLEKVEEIEAPVDAGAKGEFIYLVEKYCTERVVGRHPDELLTARPYYDPETKFIYFRSTDMLDYMRKRKFNIGAREAWNILRELKAKPRSFMQKGKFVRTWGVPMFTLQTESFDPVDVEREDEDDSTENNG